MGDLFQHTSLLSIHTKRVFYTLERYTDLGGGGHVSIRVVHSKASMNSCLVPFHVYKFLYRLVMFVHQITFLINEKVVRLLIS